MEEFLKTVARHYCDKSRQEAGLTGEPVSLPLSRYLFCFPNRRSSLFFTRYLRQAFGASCAVPSFTTISEFFGQFSTRHVAERTSLLFLLFQVYDRLSQRKEKETFDQFVFWGDMLLSDFDDVDKYLVDADSLFSNVRDLKEIEARFAGFTEEQIRVIQSFWIHFRADKEFPEGDKHEVFGQTWAILSELYHAFRQSLAAENLAYEGMMEREVVETMSGSLSYPSEEIVPACKADSENPFAELTFEKVVFVGLTAVSEVDRRLMSLLQLHGRAEFCWDYADPRLCDPETLATSAAYFTRRNLSDFGNELSEEELQRGLVPENQREVSLYSVASGVGQTLQARQILQQWSSEEGFDPLRTAVVLPDEKLLLPMLYAVPCKLDGFNVTMGYSLRTTPVAAFVELLANLQEAWKEERKSFYFRQVLPLLSHTFTLGIAGREARAISKDIVIGNLNQVCPSLFAGNPFLRSVFRPVSSASDTLSYLLELLEMLMKRAALDIEHGQEQQCDANGQFDLDFEAEEKPEHRLFADTDYEFLYHYRKTVLQLQKEVLSHPAISFNGKTLFLLLNKLVAGVSVPFSGEPLNGLQLMGVLETRSLDFDNIIILSMNEGVFPAKPVQNTFVPMSLRDAFGLPTQRHRDSVFAYHFYRLIGRARRLVLIYDSRTEGMQTGEESRYVKQLRYLMGHDQLKPQTTSDDIGVVSSAHFAIRKTPEVMAELSRCLEGGDLYLSATSLKNYIQCPLKFYLSFVRQLQQDDEVTEGVDAMLFGDILHNALHELYKTCEGRRVEASMLERHIKNPELEVIPAIYKAFSELMHVEAPEGYNLIVAQILANYVVETLRHDQSACPFDYLAGERKQRFVFAADAQTRVRIKCIYDRIDRPVGQGETIRIVDYKTGSSKLNNKSGGKLQFASVNDLFDPQGKASSEAFQVMLYSLLLGKASPTDLAKMKLEKLPAKIAPHLYFVRDFSPRKRTSTCLEMGSGKTVQPISDFSPYQAEMEERLKQMLLEIFNPDIPFEQCTDPKRCEYCPFTSLCKV